MPRSLSEALQTAAWRAREDAIANSAGRIATLPKLRLPRRTTVHVDLASGSKTPSPEVASTGQASTGQASTGQGATDPLTTLVHQIEIDGQHFTVQGNAVLCPCPDCAAPLTVRVWLGVADCWRCGCALELDRQVWDTLRQRVAAVATPRAAAQHPQRAPLPPPPRPAQPAAAQPHAASRLPSTDPLPAENGPEAELDRLLADSRLAKLLEGGFSALPAWFVSFLLHLALLLLLAMIALQQASPESLRIVLSSFIDKSHREGTELQVQNPLNQLADDQLLPPDADVAELEARETAQAVADARELASDPLPLAPLPDLDSLKRNLTVEPARTPSLAVRDPRLRSELLEKAGGTTQTEAAVARGLRWLASVQNQDGSWSLANYERHAREDNQGDAAGTSLALLPFLGAGQTQEFGRYKATVARGLAWLIANQKPNGDLRANFNGQAGMYAHGQAAIVLCEAFAMTGDEKLRQPAQLAIDFIEQAQHSRGGWRYQPGEPGDTSVFGWQLMALQSARAARGGIAVSDETLKLADYYLDLASKPRGQSRVPAGALYRYLPDDGSFTPAMTAEGLLCRMYLGWPRDNPRLMTGVRWLVDEHLPTADKPNLYYWYYGTQVLHHYGGRPWETWNKAVRELLVGSQLKKGKHPGSWEPSQFEWGAQGERIFVTSLAVCTLEVYYRHLPLFEPLALDD
ncbi:MAG: prenyltransferase/squalene oxidase repeat-containing protein [Planctomycetota bacterium]